MHGTDEAERLALEMANQRALQRFAWILGIGLAFSLTLPSLFFAAAMSSASALGAGILATIALLARDDIFSPHLSRWDVAAALYAVSLFAGFFVDLEVLQLHMMAQTYGMR